MDSSPLLQNSDHYFSANEDDEDGQGMSNTSWRPPTPPHGSRTTSVWSGRALDLMNTLGRGGAGVDGSDLSSSCVMDVGIVSDRTRYDESLLMMQQEEGACPAVAGDDAKNKNTNKNKSKRLTMLKNILQRRRQQQAPSNENDTDHDGEYKPMGGQGGVHTRNVQYAGVLDDNETADRIRNQCSLFYNGADEEQQYNTASTQINTMRTSNELRQKAHSTGSSIYDAENPAARNNSGVFDPITINSEDFSVSTLFRKDNDGKCQYRLPTDHVRLSVIPNVEPGILSMVVGSDDRRESFKKGKATATDSFKSTATAATVASGVSESLNDASIVRVPNKHGKSNETENSWNSVSYVLSIDEHLYRRVVQEMADSMQSPYGCYNCCRDTSDSGRVSIQIAIFILAVFFFFLFITTLIFPTT
uniref:Uncharacterized protein n=1 Tax=Leptocylindrus danicus TaxID=163516 RepID=A0A7S2KQS9_9STRA|mmetsp:Transcript_25562/g.38163  ORF Transcript_25562/g.38163 Transcript_25562/m.38163 type:complete len:417 (+) Transcript_25562:107-1357(+)